MKKTLFKYLSLFLVSIPLLYLSTLVSFMQNDDWVHYRTVERFLSGNFTLEPIIGSTFYVQGLLGFIWASIFNLESLPVLTMLISLISIGLYFYLLNNLKDTKWFYAVLISLLLLFNPIFFYSILGFMTDNYQLLFLILSFIFFEKLRQTSNHKFFYLMNIFAICGFFVKQSFIVFFVSAILYFILNKWDKIAIYQTFITSVLLIGYFLFFPMTEVMQKQTPQLRSFDGTVVFLLTTSIYLVSFSLPLLFSNLLNYQEKIQVKKEKLIFLITAIASGIGVLFLKRRYFVDLNYPYILNTFTRKGFYTYGLSGNKYHWKGYFDFFEYWEIASLFLLGVSLIFLIYKFRENFLTYIKNFYLIFIFVYLGLLYTSSFIYDRYLLLLLPPVFILMSSGLKKIKIYDYFFITGFLSVLMILNYIYSIDFITWQNYIWHKSELLVLTKNISYQDISATHAYNNYYESKDLNSNYFFTFDKPEVVSQSNLTLVEVNEINFPFNLFIDSYVYLYERNSKE